MFYLKKNNSIIVYGAGDYGRTVTKYLLEESNYTFQLISIAVTNEPKEKELMGVPVNKIEHLLQYRNNSLVIIAVSDEKQESIRENLEKWGFHNYVAVNRSLYQELQQKINHYQNIEKSMQYSQEVLWALNFDRTIRESKWLIDKDFVPGGFAVGNHYLYLLYRMLDSGRFTSVLDIGMGQTTKLITQYARCHKNVSHFIVEEDEEWIDFVGDSYSLADNSQICRLNYKMEEKEEYKVRVYEDFAERFKGEKFGIISIDAPWGGGMKKYSRIDILNILPDCLKESWAIMIDDTQRWGEQNTVREIISILQKNNIAYQIREFVGEKKFVLIVSQDNRFFCTI